ncbi:unnamed protein product [Closterium sp. Yama58-4]|nr:unnamed protein product [Closterium sp. Yama58-4]
MATSGEGGPDDGSSARGEGLWGVPKGVWRGVCLAGVVGVGAMVARQLKHRAEEQQVLQAARLTAVGIKDTVVPCLFDMVAQVRVMRAVGKAHSSVSQAVATVGGAVEEAAAGASTVGAEMVQEVAGAVQGMADAVQEVAEAGRQAVARSAAVGSAVQSGARGLVREQVEALVVDEDARVLVQAGDSLWRISQRCQVPLEALRRANPQVQGDRLLEGSYLSLPHILVNELVETQVVALE